MANDKTVTTTLGELVEAEQALHRVSQQDSMTAKARYHVVKLARLVAQETKHFSNEQNKLYEELGFEREATPQERVIFRGPTVREPKPEHRQQFQARLKELAAVEVTIPWGPVKSSDLPKALASDLIGLGPLCDLVEPEG